MIEDQKPRLPTDPEWALLYQAWRVRYQQARRILERYMPEVIAYERLLPDLFTDEIITRIKSELDEGKHEYTEKILKDFQSMYLRRVRQQREDIMNARRQQITGKSLQK